MPATQSWQFEDAEMTKIRTSEIDPLKILLIFVDLMLNTVL